MTHRFPPPDHNEPVMTDAEAAQEWFDEWFGHWLSDQSDEGYEIAVAQIERRELEQRGDRLADSYANQNSSLSENTVNSNEKVIA